MSDATADVAAGIAIAMAIPVVFMFASFLRKRVPHGEARFDEHGKLIDDE